MAWLWLWPQAPPTGAQARVAKRPRQKLSRPRIWISEQPNHVGDGVLRDEIGAPGSTSRLGW